MPIYAYRCSDCGFEQDVLQKFSDAPLTVCPSCGGTAFAKQLTAPAFQLKGSGWYVTDFRDGGAKKKSDAQTGSEAAADTPGEKAAEPSAAGAGAEGARSAGAGDSSPAASDSAQKPAGKASAAATPAAATPAARSTSTGSQTAAGGA